MRAILAKEVKGGLGNEVKTKKNTDPSCDLPYLMYPLALQKAIQESVAEFAELRL